MFSLISLRTRIDCENPKLVFRGMLPVHDHAGLSASRAPQSLFSAGMGKTISWVFSVRRNFDIIYFQTFCFAEISLKTTARLTTVPTTPGFLCRNKFRAYCFRSRALCVLCALCIAIFLFVNKQEQGADPIMA